MVSTPHSEAHVEEADLARSDSRVATREQIVFHPYPEELYERVVIAGARTLVLRPIRAEDEEKLVSFHSHLSADSIYCRYFSFHPELSDEETYHLTHVDYEDRLALVLEDGVDLVAVARYERYPGTADAEAAFVVRDDYQHLGLGHHPPGQCRVGAGRDDFYRRDAVSKSRHARRLSSQWFPAHVIGFGRRDQRAHLPRPSGNCDSNRSGHSVMREHPWS